MLNNLPRYFKGLVLWRIRFLKKNFKTTIIHSYAIFNVYCKIPQTPISELTAKYFMHSLLLNNNSLEFCAIQLYYPHAVLA